MLSKLWSICNIFLIVGIYIASQNELHDKLTSRKVASEDDEITLLYPHLIETVKDILRHCPPKDCIVIGVGQSPSLFMTLIEEFSPNSFSLPLSDFRYYPIDTANKHANDHRRVFPTEELPKLFEHFRRYSPHPEVFKGKRVMPIDFGLTGKSLFAASHFYQLFMKSRGIHSNITPLLLHIEDEGGMTIPIFNKIAHDHGILDFVSQPIPSPSILAIDLKKQKLDDFSPYGSWSIQVDLEPKRAKSQKYTNAKGYLISRLSQDEKAWRELSLVGSNDGNCTQIWQKLIRSL